MTHLRTTCAALAVFLWIVGRSVAAESATDYLKKGKELLDDARAIAEKGHVRGDANAFVQSRAKCDEAAAHFSRAITLDPKNPQGYYYRGLANRDSHTQADRAIADFTEVIRLNPKFPGAHSQRGYIYLSMKRDYPKALVDLNQALRLDPTDEEAFGYRAIAFYDTEKYAEAISDSKEIIRLRPRSPGAHAWLAQILACCPEPKYRNGKEALKNATEACKLSSWNEESAVRVLAAAHAELGDFDKAVKWQKKAIELARFDVEVTRKLKQKTLDLYKQRKPLRIYPPGGR